MSWDEGFAVGLAVGRKKFGGGTPIPSDEWVYPPEWIQVPRRAEANKGYFVISLGELTESAAVEITLLSHPNYDGSIVIDWGDGDTTVCDRDNQLSAANHTYTHGSGHLLDTGAEQYLLSIECDPAYDEDTDLNYYTVKRVGGSWGSSYGLVVAASVDSGIIYDSRGEIFFNTQCASAMNYLSLSGDVGRIAARNSLFRDFNSLKKLDLFSETPIEEIYLGSFVYCYTLGDSIINKFCKDVKKIGSNCFQGMYSSRSLNFPALEEIESGSFRSCYGLYRFNAPRLATVNSTRYDECFYNCQSLYYFTASEGFDIADAKQNKYCFKNCSLI